MLGEAGIAAVERDQAHIIQVGKRPCIVLSSRVSRRWSPPSRSIVLNPLPCIEREHAFSPGHGRRRLGTYMSDSMSENRDRAGA